MKVKELIERLKEFDGGFEVYDYLTGREIESIFVDFEGGSVFLDLDPEG